jgi:hypothetical protein
LGVIVHSVAIVVGFNTYADVNGQPTLYVDPDGLQVGVPLCPPPSYRGVRQPVPSNHLVSPGPRTTTLRERFELAKESFGNLDKNTFSNLNYGGDIPGGDRAAAACVPVTKPSTPGTCPAERAQRLVFGSVIGPRRR